MAMHVAHRGSLFHLLEDPRFNQDCVEFIEDGVLLVSDGAIISAGPAKEILDKLPAGTDVIDHNDAVLVPGFFDLHVHSPQLTTVAIYGEQLLGWLNTIIPEEEVYKDPETATNRADIFIEMPRTLAHKVRDRRRAQEMAIRVATRRTARQRSSSRPRRPVSTSQCMCHPCCP